MPSSPASQQPPPDATPPVPMTPTIAMIPPPRRTNSSSASNSNSNNNNNSNNNTSNSDNSHAHNHKPTSVEEAAALLGTCITRLSNQSVYRTNTPPPGMHSAFSTVKPIPCSELYCRLDSLHSLLKQACNDNNGNHNSNGNGNGNGNDNHVILQAAPSIIPVLLVILVIEVEALVAL